MPTLEGVFFIPAAVHFFFFRPRLLFPLLILSTVFEASSIISSGSVGIQPYYCVAILFVIRFSVRKPSSLNKEDLPGRPTFIKLWVAFCIVSVISAISLPLLFQGTPVFDGKRTIEDNVLSGGVPLHFQSGNIVQPAFLILNVLVVITAARQRHSIDKAQRMFMWSAGLIIAIVLLQVAFFGLGIPFPNQLINNNPGYGLVNLLDSGSIRPSGSFTEPSALGAVLAALVSAFLWKFLAHGTGIVVAGVAAVACLLAASTSALAALLIVFILLLVAYPVVRLPWFIRLNRLKRISVIFGFLGASTLLTTVPSIRAILLSQTIEKSESVSAFARFGADAFAFNLLPRTYGLGVGLGSNRPSSFLAAILSQVGIIGFALFCCAAWSTLWNLPKADRWIGVAAFGLLIAMAFGLPDLSFPFLWILFALSAQSKASAQTQPDKESCILRPAQESS